MTIRARAALSATLATALLGGCASQATGIAPSVAPQTTASITPAETVSRLPAVSGYRMSPEELSLDCKKLTGRMAIRIVQIRDFQTRSQATSLSRGMQQVTKPVWGGSGAGSDPDSRYTRDRAMLDAYNHRLAEKDCANFDLDAELAPGVTEPPRTRPVRKSS